MDRLQNDYHTPKQRQRYLDNDDIRVFILWLNAHYDTPAKHLKLSLMLGTRLMELLSIRWDNVNLGAETIKLTKTKTKQDLTIKLPHQALAIFQELHSIKHSDYVFANGVKHFSSTAPNTRIKKIINDAGIVKFSVHDLRRTFGTQLAALNYPHDLIDCAMNHKLQGVKRNYIHTDMLEQRYTMLQAWADYLDRLVYE